MSFINLSEVTKALTEQLKSDAALVEINALIKRGEYINMNPDLALSSPWIGVYKSDTAYDPRTLGKHSMSWDGTVSIRLVVQATANDNGALCEERLADWEAKVLDAAWSDTTWGGKIDMITGLNSEYSYNETKSETMYFQQVVITITARLSTG